VPEIVTWFQVFLQSQFEVNIQQLQNSTFDNPARSRLTAKFTVGGKWTCHSLTAAVMPIGGWFVWRNILMSCEHQSARSFWRRWKSCETVHMRQWWSWWHLHASWRIFHYFDIVSQSIESFYLYLMKKRNLNWNGSRWCSHSDSRSEKWGK